MYNIWPQNIVIITIVSLQGNTTSLLTIKYLTITYSTFPFPGIVVMPYVFVAGTFLYELSLSYNSFIFLILQEYCWREHFPRYLTRNITNSCSLSIVQNILVLNVRVYYIKQLMLWCTVSITDVYTF